MNHHTTAFVRANKVMSALLVAALVFNAVVRFLGLEAGIYALTAALILFNAAHLLLRPRIRPQVLWLMPMAICGAIAAAWTVGTLPAVIAAAGAVGAFAYLLLWALQLGTGAFGDDEDFIAWHVRLHVICGFITAGLAIYQYFFNSDLWGVLPERPWTDPTIIAGGRFTKRATGLVGSPQNLGLYMGLAAACVVISRLRPWLKLAYGGVILAAGMLSGSAAFIAFVIMLAAGYFWNGRRIHAMVLRGLLVIPVLIGIVLVQNVQDIENREFSALYMGNPLEDRIPVYMELLDYDGPYSFVFGHGLGTANRVTEVLLGEGRTPREWKPSESYLATTAHEMGLAGLFAFGLVYVVAMWRASKLGGPVGQIHLGLLVAMFGNLFATPSFTGLTMAAIGWPFILYPLFARKHVDVLV